MFRALILALSVALLAACSAIQPAAGEVENAFNKHRSNVQVTASGTVEKVLPDDTSGLPHQRFIIRLASGETLLVEHNIDLAARLDGLKPGDEVRFAGEYIWNERGGLVHWTHHDPAGKHPGGWIEWQGKRYE